MFGFPKIIHFKVLNHFFFPASSFFAEADQSGVGQRKDKARGGVM